MPTIQELRKTPHWSYSALNSYLNICQLQYFFRYIEQAEVEQTSACFAFGKAFHAALSEQAREVQRGGSLTREEVCECFADAFGIEVEATSNLLCKPGEDKDSMIALAERMLDTSLAEWSDYYNVKSVAEAFSITVPGLDKPLIGEFDLVVDDGRNSCIVDWKTSACRWSAGKADRDLQATVFSYAFRQLYDDVPIFRFDVITKTKTPSYERHYTSRGFHDFQRFEVLANQAQEAISKGVFLPSETSFACAECPYKSRCRSWHIGKR